MSPWLPSKPIRKRAAEPQIGELFFWFPLFKAQLKAGAPKKSRARTVSGDSTGLALDSDGCPTSLGFLGSRERAREARVLNAPVEDSRAREGHEAFHAWTCPAFQKWGINNFPTSGKKVK